MTEADQQAEWAGIEAQLRGPQPPDDALMQRVEALRLDDPARMARALSAALSKPALAAQPAMKARVLLALGLSQANLRQLDEAMDTLQKTHAMATAAGATRLARSAAEALPWVLIWKGDFGAAAMRLREAFDGALQAADTHSLVRALGGLAQAAACSGRHEHARRLDVQIEMALQTAATPMSTSQKLAHAHNHCVRLMLAVLDAWLAGQGMALQRQLKALAAAQATAARRARQDAWRFVATAQRSLAALRRVLSEASLQEPDPDWTELQRPLEMGEEYGHLAEAIKARRRGDFKATLAHAHHSMKIADPVEYALQLALRQEMGLAHAGLGQFQAAWQAGQEAEALAVRRDNEIAATQLDTAMGAVWRERSLTAALVGHDLRSPIAAIRALSQPEPAADEAGATLREVGRLAGRALAYADEFLQGLELQHLDREHFTAVPVQALMADAADEVLHTADKATQIEQRVESGLVVFGHAPVLHRALVNLMLNALQAARKKGLPQRLVLSASRGSDGAMLAVRDHGPGIPAASLRGLFDDEPQTEVGRHGFGLGLRTVARCARAMDGVLLAMNHAEGGATVALSLPLPLLASAGP